jgi:MerR family transcriptional regulator, copper efflux regulator
MNIGTVAKLTGLNTKTIRYYEQVELITPAKRSENGYRQYSDKELEQLIFVQRARKTGFNIEECRQLLSLFNDTSRQSHHVKELVLEKAELVAKQIEELKLMQACLLDLASQCQSDETPHCAILDRLSEKKPLMESSS